MARGVMEHPIFGPIVGEIIRVGVKAGQAAGDAFLREVGASARQVEKKTKIARQKMKKAIDDVPSEFVDAETYDAHDNEIEVEIEEQPSRPRRNARRK